MNANNNNNSHIDERLWDYIDGNLSVDDKSVIENLLKSDMEWRAKYQELLEVQQLLHSTELEEPSMRFTRNVMDEIAKSHIAPAASTYINKNIIRGIAIVFIAMIVGFLIYGLRQVVWTEGEEHYTIDLSRIDISKFFNNAYMNIFMMINVVLGLFLLDRILGNKKKQVSK
jgi:hypothetical protein